METREYNCNTRGCPGVVKVSLEFEPGESNWGADADGNRGISVPGYWSATIDGAKSPQGDRCSCGHWLYGDEVRIFEEQAIAEMEQEVADNMENYADGPDYDAEDDY